MPPAVARDEDSPQPRASPRETCPARLEIRRMTDDGFEVQVFVGEDDARALQEVIDLRMVVFVVEQAVPVEEEVDGKDPAAVHVALRRNGEVVGTARLRVVDGVGKIERVAIDRSRRGLGLGRRVMEAVEWAARDAACLEALLAAQVQVIPFYEKLGYVAEGPVFLDAKIDHRWMRKALRGEM